MSESRVLPITAEEKITFLQSIPAFQELSHDNLKFIAEMLQYQKCDPQYIFFQEGEPGHSLFILKLGEAAVIKGGAQVATLSSRDIFGEMGILNAAPRNASVSAINECYYFVLPGFSLTQLMQENSILKQFFEKLAESRSQ